MQNFDEIEVSFVCYDGLKTVEGIRRKQPDTLILDMVMPHLDGLGVLETINDMELEQYPRIIVLSGGRTGADHAEGCQSACGSIT